MEENKFYDLINLAEGVSHVKIYPPSFSHDDMEIEFLDGPLEGSFATVSNYNFEE